jgi:hypothetical protein
VAGAAGLLGLHARAVAAAPTPETTTIRLAKAGGGICVAPKYVAEALLQADGCTDVHYAEEGQKSPSGLR